MKLTVTMKNELFSCRLVRRKVRHVYHIDLNLIDKSPTFAVRAAAAEPETTVVIDVLM
jgi:hypothetical protein